MQSHLYPLLSDMIHLYIFVSDACIHRSLESQFDNSFSVKIGPWNVSRLGLPDYQLKYSCW